MIKITDLCFSYKNQPVFENFNLEIRQGETTLITGINGTGKTTLLRLMAGVLFPEKGKVEYDKILGTEPRDRIGFISDQMNLYTNMTLREAERFHARVYGARATDDELHRQARLNPGKRIRQLSAGQRLIFHLSLILSTDPAVLLIDEVLYSMDVYLRDVFLNCLLRLIEERQVTLVLVNLTYHDIESIPQRVILLKSGQVEVDEPIDLLKGKVKRFVSEDRLTGLPVLYNRECSDGHEYYIYPFHRDAVKGLSGRIEDLSLGDIVKAFIGGFYA